MKHAFAIFVGCLAGAVLAVALLYVNPLTSERVTPPAAGDWVLSYDFPADALLVSHSGRLRLPVVPAGSERLWERAVRTSLLKAVVLKDAGGAPVAAATRLTLPSSDAELLRRGLVVVDYWLVTVPGEGILAVHGESNVWPLLKEAAGPAWYLGRRWEGPGRYALTTGPDTSGALVYGVSGRFAGARGRALEQYDLRQLDAGGADFLGRLTVRLPKDVPE